jgi:hypothetical protein
MGVENFKSAKNLKIEIFHEHNTYHTYYACDKVKYINWDEMIFTLEINVLLFEELVNSRSASREITRRKGWPDSTCRRV